VTPRSLILGLDVSARRIGWALIDYDSGEVVRLGTEDTPAGGVSGDDLLERREAFTEIARTADGLGDVCAVLVEDAFVGPNRQGSLVHAMAIGNVEAFAAARWGTILVDRLRVGVWRSVLGLPARGKGPVLVWARGVVGGGLFGQDAADALAVARAAFVLLWRDVEGK